MRLTADQAFDKFPAMLAEAGIAVEQRGLAAMRVHFDLLLQWNRKVNLTAVREPEEILRRHFLESLLLTKAVKLGAGVMYDIGTGAGFPGLPVKAVHPEVEIYLVEVTQKKAAFLKEVVRKAGLNDAFVEVVRVERLVERSEIELADWVAMRAVGAVDELLPILRRLLVPHGQVVLFLGERDADGARNNVGGFTWKEPLRIPHSERRVILVGETIS